MNKAIHLVFIPTLLQSFLCVLHAFPLPFQPELPSFTTLRFVQWIEDLLHVRLSPAVLATAGYALYYIKIEPIAGTIASFPFFVLVLPLSSRRVFVLHLYSLSISITGLSAAAVLYGVLRFAEHLANRYGATQTAKVAGQMCPHIA